jgi:hypothetical protein
MTPSAPFYDSVLTGIILLTLAVTLPVVMVLLIRFLWDRNLNLGRSKDLDKLIWQLHRIASAIEHQMNLSFPPVQPGTEEPRDLAYLNQIAVESHTTRPAISANGSGAQSVTPEQAPSQVSTEQTPANFPPPPETLSETPKRAGVNSMFDL